MMNAKKLIAATLIALTVAGGAGSIAKAGIKWTKGLYDGHNGYYFAYSYYYDGNFSHYSWARLGSDYTGNVYAGPDSTSQANTGSYQTMDWDAGYGY